MNLRLKKDYLNIGLLILIILLSFFSEKYFLKDNLNLPGWDQGYHLTNLFKTYNIFENFSFFNKNWWQDLWNITDSYRGPLTYILSALYLKIFGANYQNSYLSNHIFSILTILSIYNLGIILKNEATGLWASFLFTVNPFIINHRLDYLIDLSQLSLITLNFYLLTRYFLCNKNGIINSIFCGLSLGFLFLTKPTGIIFLLFPYLIIIFDISKNKQKFKKGFSSLCIILIIFLLVIYSWFSSNWLTILSSSINAWNWGINYQDGLDINSLEGNIFYLRKIYALFEPFMIWSLVILLVTDQAKKFRGINNSIFEFKYSKIKSKKIIWYLIMPLNILIICTLMSTKVMRFILPIYPYLCLFSAFFINNLRQKYWINLYKMFLIASLIMNIYFYFGNKKIAQNKIINYPHQEIINSISNYSPRLNAVVAVIPDTKTLNTFNLESEAALQNNGVSFRQVVSNKDNYKEDLERFNWFLIKDKGDMGVMINDAKIKLSELVKISKSFKVFKSFPLPDGSNVKIYKRKIDNISVEEISRNFNNPVLDINKLNDGLKLRIKGKKDILDKSYLLINIEQGEEIYELNISLPNIKDNLNNENILIEQNIKSNFLDKNKTPINITGTLITKNNRRLNLKNIEYKNVEFSEENINDSQILEVNKLEELEKMGRFLKEGEFDSLFSLVGLINQTDPDQTYLKDGELIFNERLKLNKNNYDYLYKIAISQILQKKSKDASITLEKLIDFDDKNSNLFLAKSIVEIYNFNPRKANLAIKKSQKLNRNENLTSTIETVNVVADIFNFNFKTIIQKIFI